MSSERKSLALHVTSMNLVSFEKRMHSRIGFSMIPTGEIGFGCHVTLVLEVIDFFQNIS